MISIDSIRNPFGRFLQAVAVPMAVITGCCAAGMTADLRAAEPLEVGQWYDSQGRSVAESRLHQQLHQADTVLLGEVHDARDIHRKQIELLQLAVRPVVLAMEQLDLVEPGSPLTARGDTSGRLSARERAEQAGFDLDAWGWEHYGALFSLAAQQRWPLWGINLPRDTAMAVARSENADWPDRLTENQLAAVERLSPALSLPTPQQQDLLAELKMSHCGRLSTDHLPGMLRAQVARDILMADALSGAHRAYPDHLLVAIMGNQHARLDRGAGYWLSRLGGDGDAGKVVSIGMLPINTIDQSAMTAAAYDFVWVTRPIERDHGCGR